MYDSPDPWNMEGWPGMLSSLVSSNPGWFEVDHLPKKYLLDTIYKCPVNKSSRYALKNKILQSGTRSEVPMESDT